MSVAMALALLGLLPLAPVAEAPAPPRKVGGEIQEPRKVKNVVPQYPEDARRAGLAGVVVLECTLDPQGAVAEAVVLRGVPPLTDAAIKAVRQWRYTPTLLDGVAVPVIMTVTVNFKMDSVRYGDLRASLRHRNENIREAAALNLGQLRVGGTIDLGDVRDAIGALEVLAQRDESPRVRDAAGRSLSRLDGRPLPAGLPPDAPAADPAAPDAEDKTPANERAAEAMPPTPPLDEHARAPRPIRITRPEYPAAAFKKRVEGTVVIEILIDTQGRVAKRRVIQSVPGLDEAALKCISQWRFEPALKDGKPVATIAHAPIHFRIYASEK
jgi:TonB family protein